MKKLLNLICILFFSLTLISSISANDDYQSVKNKLPKLLGASNAGREFWITFNPCWETPGELNHIKIYVSSTFKTLVRVEVPGKGFILPKYSVPNDVIEFILSPAIGQCYSKKDTDPPQKEHVFVGYGVHVYADDPIICYGVTRYHWTSDGFLALPVTSIGTEYVVASYADPSDSKAQYLPSEVGIVAPYDNTTVTFKVGGNTSTKTAGGLLPNQDTTFVMNKGDVFLVSGSGHLADLSGSRINSDKPVSVVSGNFCPYIPSDKGYCDFITEMEIPTNTWGKEYHVSAIKTRLKNSIIKIFAKEPNTTIYRNGINITTLAATNGVEGNGYIEIGADTASPNNVVISGNKPISVTQYNTGQDDDGVSSDPFQMVLTPIEQYQKEVIFNTPGKNGNGFTSNYVNLIYQPDINNNLPDDIEFATVQNGEYSWQKLNQIDSIPGKPFKFDVLQGKYRCKTITLPGDGVYKIRANKPFAAYSYGFSDYESYGFPVGVSLIEKEKIDSIPPKSEYTIYPNGLITGKTIDLPNDTKNRSNLAEVYFISSESNNFKFSENFYIPSIDSSVSWSLNLIDSTRKAKAYLYFSDRCANDTLLYIEYVPQLTYIKPLLLEPFNNSENQKSQITFKWNNIEISNKYLLQVATDETFINPIINIDTIRTNQFLYGALQKGTKYYWRVKAINDNSESQWSEIWSFITEDALFVDEQNNFDIDNFIYPNPIKDLNLASILLHKSGIVTLKLINVFGIEIQTIIDNKFMDKGKYNISLQSNFLQPGFYYFILRLNNESFINKCIIY